MLSNLEFLRVNGDLGGGWDPLRDDDGAIVNTSLVLANTEILCRALARVSLKRFELGKIQLEYDSWQKWFHALKSANAIKAITFYNVCALTLENPKKKRSIDSLSTSKFKGTIGTSKSLTLT
jgi:hypothetical protein